MAKQSIEPSVETLVDEHGGGCMPVRFRKGEAFRRYVEFRLWCWHNKIAPNDIMNALIGPITDACQNFARRDGDHITITFHIGDVTLEQAWERVPWGQRGMARKAGSPGKVWQQKYNDTRAKTHIV